MAVDREFVYILVVGCLDAPRGAPKGFRETPNGPRASQRDPKGSPRGRKRDHTGAQGNAEVPKGKGTSFDHLRPFGHHLGADMRESPIFVNF